MNYKYSAQNHDWDLTLHASAELLAIGRQLGTVPRIGGLSKGFSCFVGSMLLAFCAIESYTTSVAFAMQYESRFREFNFERYKRANRFWNKLEMVCGAAGITIDKSQGLFQKISEMQAWRNLVTHSSPYSVDSIPISDTITEPRKIHKRFTNMEYARAANAEMATSFYSTAYEFIKLMSARSGIVPRASASYEIGEGP